MNEVMADFEAAWPELKPQLERMLRHRGASPDVAEDVLQETAIRLLKSWTKLDRTRSLAPFARTIAINCLIDLHRGRRLVPVEDVPDEPSGYDLEEHALSRVRLAKVEAALDDLAPKDRTVLLAEVGLGARGDNGTTKMARLRARKRLVAAMDRVAAAFGGVQLGWRRVGVWFETYKSVGESLLPVVAAASIVGAAAFATPPDVSRAEVARPHRIARIETVSATRRIPRDHDRVLTNAARRTDSAPANAEVAPETRPTPEPSQSENTVVDTDNAQARTREGKGYKGAEVCTGDSEAGDAWVTVYDGNQDGNEPEHCS